MMMLGYLREKSTRKMSTGISNWRINIFPEDSSIEVIERITVALNELGIRVTEVTEGESDDLDSSIVRTFEFTHAEKIE